MNPNPPETLFSMPLLTTRANELSKKATKTAKTYKSTYGNVPLVDRHRRKTRDLGQKPHSTQHEAGNMITLPSKNAAKIITA